MRRIAVALLLLLSLAVLAPTTQAAFTKALPFDMSAPYMGGLGTSGTVTVTSGAIEADVPRVNGTMGLFGTDAFSITGLTKACWVEGSSAPCREGALTLQVGARSAVGLCFPGNTRATYDAGHALVLFIDLATDDDLNSLPVVRSLVAPSIDGRLSLSGIPVIADVSPTSSPCTAVGAIAALDANTSLVLRSAAGIEKSFTGKQGLFLFAGSPTVAPVAPDLIILPFGQGAAADFTRSSTADATAGLDTDRIGDLVGNLDQSHSSTTTTRDGNISDAIADLPSAIKRLLNGALLQMPPQAEGEDFDPSTLTFARFTTMRVEAGANLLTWEGRAVLAAQDGRIEHTHNLVGVAMFSLPWWSIVLWLAAITVWIVRLVMRPDKHSRWDSLRWIGWIATPVAVIVVFLLVDVEVRHLFGASFLSGATGQARWVFLLITLVFTGLLGFMAGAPLRMLLRNSFLLLRQGTFMGLAGSIATILALFFGVWYFRDYLDLVFSQVMSKLG